MAHKSGGHDEGLEMLVATVLVMAAALTLVLLAGSFGHTHKMSDDRTPVWSVQSWSQ